PKNCAQVSGKGTDIANKLLKINVLGVGDPVSITCRIYHPLPSRHRGSVDPKHPGSRGPDPARLQAQGPAETSPLSWASSDRPVLQARIAFQPHRLHADSTHVVSRQFLSRNSVS